MKTAPVSAVITTYNSERFVIEAIESVRAQTLPVDEIIVIDNNSEDKTREIAEANEVKVFIENKKGPAAARNRGITVCRNEWIAFLDADDLWEKEKIYYQWQAIEKFPDARIISCDAGVLHESTKEKVPAVKSIPADFEKKDTILDKTFSYSSHLSAQLFQWFWIISSSVILHRDVFKNVGVFDESLYFMEDMEFFCRALKKFPITTVNKNLAFYRKHDQNMTLDAEDLEKHEIKLITEYVLKYPEKYLPGAGDYLIERQKNAFVNKGIALANRIKRPRSK